MKFNVSFELYIDVGVRYISQTWKLILSLESEQKQGR